MDFLKHHYEKITLVGLFILFIFLMWLITSLDAETREVQESELRLATEIKDYESEAEVKNVNADARNLWQKSEPLNWEISSKQGAGFDLIQASQFALCPACEAENTDGDKRLIPLSAFGKECPNCKTKLALPVLAKVRRGKPTPDDLDGDGISNSDEDRFGLNKNFYDDALYDKDGDGFSNVYEIQQKTNPADAGSHPPLWHRLSLSRVAVVPLGFTLRVIDHKNRYRDGKYTDADKKLWTVSYNYIDRMGKPRTRFARLGGSINIEKVNYRIVDIVLPRNPAHLGKPEGKDQTYLILREVLRSGVKRQPDQLKMIITEELKSSDQRPILRDSGFPETDTANGFRSMKIGASFMIPAVTNVQKAKLGTGRRGRNPRYQLKAVERGYIVLYDLNTKPKDGKYPEIKITRDGAIPKDMWVVQDNGQNADQSGMNE